MSIFNNEIMSVLFSYIKNIRDIYSLIRTCKAALQCYRNTNVLVFCNKAHNKYEMLQIFISYYEYLPKQGSIEWIIYRQGSELLPPVIGGSEIKDLIKTPKSVAKRKLKLDNFSGSIHTQWGNIFEEIFGQIIDCIFYTHSKETGSIPGLRNELGQVIQSYSPDRLLVTNIDRLNILFNEENTAPSYFAEKLLNFQQKIKATGENHVIVLCEFKCPSVNIPTGYIPDNYTMQPPTGLATIPVADIGLFANNSIRKCKLDDFNLTLNYDRIFHHTDMEKQLKNPALKFKKPMFLGFIGVYQKTSKSCATNYLTKPEILTKQTLWQMLDQYMLRLIADSKSDYYQLEWLCSNVASLTNICLDFVFNNNYSDSIITEYLIAKLKPEDPVLITSIINDIINNYYKNYKPEFGKDFGNSDEFYKYAKLIVDKRFTEDGPKLYYDAGLLVEKNTADNLQLTENCDIAQNNRQCQIWIKRKIREFLLFCKQNNYESVGIIPYKLFKIAMIPVFPEENYMDKYKDIILNFANNIQEIKKEAHEQKIVAEYLNQFYQQKLNSIYGGDQEFKPKPIIYEVESTKFDQDIVDEFNSL